MTPTQIAVIVGVFVVMDTIIVSAVLSMAAGALNDLGKAHPRVAATPQGVRREFQSIGIDLINLGGCVHIVADELRWHLEPAWLLRVFGARPASIPWVDVHDVRLRSDAATRGTAKIGKTKVRAPAWCLKLALGRV